MGLEAAFSREGFLAIMRNVCILIRVFPMDELSQVIGLTEIFGQQLQTGEHLLHICGGRADGAAVEALRRVRIERRLLLAGAADPAGGLGFVGLEKSGVDGAEQHVAVEDRDDVFTKSCVAHAKVGAAKPLTFVVHPADHGEAGVIVLLIGLHVHTEWICVREKGGGASRRAAC